MPVKDLKTNSNGGNHLHTNSIDFDGKFNRSMNSSFTSGFRSTGITDSTKNSSTISFNELNRTIGRSQPKYERRYGKYRMNVNVPLYDFAAGDSPLLNKSKLNTNFKGKEQNFKINLMKYEKEFDSARPIAHTKNRKY